MTQDKDLMVEQKFPISKSGYTLDKLMDGTECQNIIRYRSKQVIYV